MWPKLHYENCDELSQTIKEIGEEIIEESLENEIRETMISKYNHTNRKATPFLSDIEVKNHNRHINVGLDVYLIWGGNVVAPGTRTIHVRAMPF